MYRNYYSTIFLLSINFALHGCSSLFESDNQLPPTELVDYENQVNVKILWTKNVGDGNANQALRLMPVFKQDRIYIADLAGEIQALDAKTGERIWIIDTQTQLSSGPGLGTDQIIVGTNKAEVIAVAESDGHELWRALVNNQVAAISTVPNETVVVHTIDGKLHALNADTGKKIWDYSRTEPALTLRGGSSPIIDDNAVIAGLSNGILINLNLATGEPNWEAIVTQSRGRSELERIIDIDIDPIIQDNMVYTATYQGDVAGIDLITGVITWRRKMSVYSGMTFDNLHLYVTDANSRVWALYLQDGVDVWQQEALLHRRLTAPAILGNYIIVGDLDGYVHFLSRDDGSQQGRIHIASDPIITPPLVINETAYVYSDDGDISALTLITDNSTE
jgi:outer membrane protein assembly factor BamB